MYMKARRIAITLIILAICLTTIMVYYLYNVEASKAVQGKIDMGGYGLYVDCIGKGKPTVIFESGFGCTHEDWKYVQPEIAKTTRTFSYDRAGLGKSDKFGTKRTVYEQVKELHALLGKTKVKGPYIFVAHSLGGFHARLFADMYPGEVQGIIFVDSASEYQTEYLKKGLEENQFGIWKSMFKNTEFSYDELLLSEQKVKEARKKDGLRDIPITVLSAKRKEEHALDSVSKLVLTQWMQWQKDIASLSDRSIHKTVDDAGHMIQLDQPQAVIDAVDAMIGAMR